jgi:hypothetical protein
MPYKKRLSALLSKGYFPKELPPAFSTVDFGKHITDILSDWEVTGVFSKRLPKTKKSRRDAYSYKVESAEIEVISKPKRGYERRNIHITHPVPQALLSYELAKNWRSVQKWLVRQEYSLDEIRISEKYQRSIKGINFEIHKAKKGYIEATADWLVRTDISRFYPTIYTHSIAWAAYGKEQVKANLKLYDGSLADRLDILVRACNRNQTIGIPIGPETSRILAEVISSRIDSDFQLKFPGKNKDYVDRLQDDWFVGVETLEKAEMILSAITAVYRDYGLEINGSKTSVERVIGSSGSHWVSEIGAFLSHRPGPIRRTRLRELLSLCLRLQADFPNDPVISYALSIIERQVIWSDVAEIETLESFLLKAAIISPMSMDSICRIILNIQHNTGKISRQRIGTRFTGLAERSMEKGNLYEVIWLIYTLRGLRFPLNSKFISDSIEGTHSSALALLLLDMSSKHLCIRGLPRDEWSRQITAERVATDWIWLLGYEGIRHGWLADRTRVMAKPFFRAMDSKDVCFYDPRRNIPFSKRITQMKISARKRNRVDVAKLLQTLRGFHLDDY